MRRLEQSSLTVTGKIRERLCVTKSMGTLLLSLALSHHDILKAVLA
jgi:hypothetical protein